jgi:hypothetical protein
VRWPVDRATRDSEGPASSGKPDKHRGRRHRLPALVLASWAAACMSARWRARAWAPADPRYTKLIQKNNIKKPRRIISLDLLVFRWLGTYGRTAYRGSFAKCGARLSICSCVSLVIKRSWIVYIRSFRRPVPSWLPWRWTGMYMY